MDIIVPVSGGKDSTACLLLALETHNKEDIIPLHNYTGWDPPKTMQYLDYLQDTLDIEIRTTQYAEAATIPELIRLRGQFPYNMGRFCTAELKSSATMRWYWNHGYYHDRKAECWFGMRTKESTNRARKYGGLEEGELLDYKEVFPNTAAKLAKNVGIRLPVLDWTTEQVFDYIKEKGLKYNPLYDEGNDRVGCYPCVLANKKAQTRMFETEVGKERLEIIKQLEKEIGKKYEMFDTDQGSCEVCNI